MIAHHQLDVGAERTQRSENVGQQVPLVAAVGDNDTEPQSRRINDTDLQSRRINDAGLASIPRPGDVNARSSSSPTGGGGATTAGTRSEQPTGNRPLAECWIDFHPNLFARAIYHVPLWRQKGVATITGQNGAITTVNEKLLTSELFLTLRERVEFRKRVHVFALDKTLALFYPNWDLDGPDLPYFGEWKPTVFDRTTAVAAGPWMLDGKALVADAKDRTLQMVEACIKHEVHELRLLSGFPIDYTNNRGWTMGRGPWMAWWSGVRKAAEVVARLHPSFVISACVDTNPYDGMAKVPPNIRIRCVEDAKFDRSQSCAFSYAIDPFASLLWNPSLQYVLSQMQLPIHPNYVSSLLNTTTLYPSTFPATHRHVAWNPHAKLRVLK